MSDHEKTSSFLDRAFDAPDATIQARLEYLGTRAFYRYSWIEGAKSTLNSAKNRRGMVKDVTYRKGFDAWNDFSEAAAVERALKIMAVVGTAWDDRKNIYSLYKSTSSATGQVAAWGQEAAKLAGRVAMGASPAGLVVAGAKTIYLPFEVVAMAVEHFGPSPGIRAAGETALEILDRADVYLTNSVNFIPDVLTNAHYWSSPSSLASDAESIWMTARGAFKDSVATAATPQITHNRTTLVARPRLNYRPRL